MDRLAEEPCPALRLAAAACCSSEVDLEGRLHLADRLWYSKKLEVENLTSQKAGGWWYVTSTSSTMSWWMVVSDFNIVMVDGGI